MIGVRVINMTALKGREGVLKPPCHLLLKNNNSLSNFVNDKGSKFDLKVL